MTSPAEIGGRYRFCCSGVPWAIIDGPIQLAFMYWGPRGSPRDQSSSPSTASIHGGGLDAAELLGPVRGQPAPLGEQPGEATGVRRVGLGAEDRGLAVPVLGQLVVEEGHELAAMGEMLVRPNRTP